MHFVGPGFYVHVALTPLRPVRAIHWRDFFPSNYSFGMTPQVMNEGLRFVWIHFWIF